MDSGSRDVSLFISQAMEDSVPDAPVDPTVSRERCFEPKKIYDVGRNCPRREVRVLNGIGGRLV